MRMKPLAWAFAVVGMLAGMPVVAEPSITVDSTKRDISGLTYSETLTLSGLKDRAYALFVAFDTADRGVSTGNWERVDFIRNLTAGDTSVEYTFPYEWGSQYRAVRYFLFESEYDGADYPVEYLMNDRVDNPASWGTAPYINTKKYLACSNVFEIVWANVTDFNGYQNENKAFGAGINANDVSGSRTYQWPKNSGVYQIIPYVMGNNVQFTPMVLATDIPPYEIYRDTVTIAADQTTYTMTKLSTGEEYIAEPQATTSGADYKSAYTLCLFSSSREAQYHAGRKRIYSARLTNTATGEKILDLEPRVVNGKPGMRDRVSGEFLVNAANTSWDFKVAPVAPAALVASAASQADAVAPVGDLTILRTGGTVRAVFAVRQLAGDIYFTVGTDEAILKAHDLVWGEPVARAVAAGETFELPIDAAAETTCYFAWRIVNGEMSSPVRRGSFTLAAPRTVSAVATVSAEKRTFLVTVGTGDAPVRLMAAYDSTDRGEAVGNWRKLAYVASVPAEGGKYFVAAPAGWGTEYRAVRFFCLDTPYDEAVDYISSLGVNKQQSVDPGMHFKVGQTLRIDWAMDELDQSTTAAETKGWGMRYSAAYNITGSRVLVDKNEIVPYIYGDNRSFTPVARPTIAEAGLKFTDVCSIGDTKTTFTMQCWRGGQVYAIEPADTPENYDSQVNLRLFSDSVDNDINGKKYPYWGVRRIYSAILTERTEDAAVSNEVMRLVPVAVDGVGAFYDEIAGVLRENTDTSSVLATGPKASTARVQSGASEAVFYEGAAVRVTACPLADGKAMFTLEVLSAGVGANTVDLELEWAQPGDDPATARAAAGLKEGSAAIWKGAGFVDGAIYEVVCRSRNDAGAENTQRLWFYYAARPIVCTPAKPAHGATAVELTFEPSASASTIYACFGHDDHGGDYLAWTHVAELAVPAGASSLAYVLPAQWGREYTRMRFVFRNDTVYPVQYLESVKCGLNSTAANCVDTGCKLVYGDTFEIEWANTTSGSYNANTTGENIGWGVYWNSDAGFAAGGRIHAGTGGFAAEQPGYDHIDIYMTKKSSNSGNLSGTYGHTPLCDDNGVPLRATDVLPYVFYREIFKADEYDYALYMTNLTTLAGYSCARTLDLGGTAFATAYNIFLFGTKADTNWPGLKRIRRARLTGKDGVSFNYVPFVNNGECAFFDTVTRTFKKRYYANRADFVAGPATVETRVQGTSPLIRSDCGLVIILR